MHKLRRRKEKTGIFQTFFRAAVKTTAKGASLPDKRANGRAAGYYKDASAQWADA